jgi:hypothetical protein
VVSYIILCHRDAPQVLRLARTIRATSPGAAVLIRHDQSPGFLDAGDAAACGAGLLVSPIKCRWARWSLVEATLEAVRHVRDRHDPDWIVVISGQDYPIRPLGEWEAAVLDGDHDAVMASEPLVVGPFRLRPYGATEGLRMRYTHRWYWLPHLGVVSRLPAKLRRGLSTLWYRLLYPIQALVVLNELPRKGEWVIGIRRRTVPWTPGTPAYKGSQWVALSRRAATVCLDGAEAERWQRYFATTLVPDEAYFQTVLENHSDIRVRRDMVSWVRWATEGTPHPAVITAAELAAAVRSGAPFARKFDDAVAPGLRDHVDRELLFTESLNVGGRNAGSSSDQARS